MKKLLTTAVLLLSVAYATAQQLKFERNASFEYYFDNREWSSKGEDFTKSMTLHRAYFTPQVGLSYRQDDIFTHRLMVGAEFRHDMGEQSWKDVFDEALAYYQLEMNARKGKLDFIAGIFPRDSVEGEYPEVIFADSFKKWDCLAEGVLLKWTGGKFYSEIACDWMGKAGYDRRERFQIFTYGRWNASDCLSLGWTASFYHYAGSDLAPGVVDNHLFNPWVMIQLPPGKKGGWQELSLKAGLMAAYQRDRLFSEDVIKPFGGEIQLKARRWNILFNNTTYFGDDQMPLFGEQDAAGNPYGHNLYFGLPFYRGFYNRSEILWTPRISSFLHLEAGARFHFGKDGWLGWQQVLSICFDLQ